MRNFIKKIINLKNTFEALYAKQEELKKQENENFNK